MANPFITEAKQEIHDAADEAIAAVKGDAADAERAIKKLAKKSRTTLDAALERMPWERVAVYVGIPVFLAGALVSAAISVGVCYLLWKA